jgi:hypothetical protein
MQINAPINQHYEIDFEKDNKTIYLTDEEQKFMGGRNLYKIELKQ